jgi:subtilisin family serine protease
MKAPKDLRPRYLIGHGESLTVITDATSAPPGEKLIPYTPQEAAVRLLPGLSKAVDSVESLPRSACPADKVVALVTMHHEFLAKSYFPADLFASFDLNPIGSRARKLFPGKWGRTPAKPLTEAPETIELYVSGKRDDLRGWARSLSHAQLHPELVQIENIRPLSELDASSRISIGREKGRVLLEAALHTEGFNPVEMIEMFRAHAKEFSADVDTTYALDVPGLVFVPITISVDAVDPIAAFTFLRTLRPITKLRNFPETGPIRSVGQKYTLVSPGPLNPALRIAVLDGGLPPNHGLPGVKQFDAIGIGAPAPRYVDHGMGVTGTLLWGPIESGIALPAPYCSVDHYRVLDVNDVGSKDKNAFSVLRRIRDVIETGSYDLINLSLGPNAPVDDGEVHLWTSTLDDLASDGSRLIVVAAGNNGEDPDPVCRVQAPADGVNCFGVGASDRRHPDWKRASYSAKGPGRRPGVKKPDVVAFGGSAHEGINVLRVRGGGYVLAEEMGTSYAAPLVTRTAVGVRSVFGSHLQPLTLKCLLIHTADPGVHPEVDVGWGHILSEKQIVECPPGMARVLYQGTLTPRKFRRARLPIPKGLDGMITITATVCYATEISAADPVNYTNSGVAIRFRPDARIYKVNPETNKRSVNAETDGFFKENAYATELEQRTRERKWETVLHATRNMRVSGLHEAVFDLHFIPRLGAGDHPNPSSIRYAMVITVQSKKYPDIYDRVLADFPSLQALTPVTIQATNLPAT